VSENQTENTEQVDETPSAEADAPAAEAEAPAAPAAEVPEPAADEPTPTEEEAVESPEATVEPTAPTKPQRSRRHVPRTERRRRPRKVRAQQSTGERAPIVREPKPERERGRRQERRGVVVSSAMDKTIVVKVDTLKMHPRYKKVIRRSQKFHAHDEQNVAKVGDLVRIVETRPLSKTKNWRLAEVVEAAR
jgi:small subunit ribosomal protein S17